jgi:hypothetical protein
VHFVKNGYVEIYVKVLKGTTGEEKGLEASTCGFPKCGLPAYNLLEIARFASVEIVRCYNQTYR